MIELNRRDRAFVERAAQDRRREFWALKERQRLEGEQFLERREEIRRAADRVNVNRWVARFTAARVALGKPVLERS